MHRHFLFVLVFVLSAGVTACFGSDYLSVSSVHDLGRNADSNLARVGEGEIFVLKTKIIHPEVEGHTELDVESMSSDNPQVVSVRPGFAKSEFIVETHAVGETVLRAKIDGDERGVLPIKVIPWGDVPAL
jgi:hypothetical protein